MGSPSRSHTFGSHLHFPHSFHSITNFRKKKDIREMMTRLTLPFLPLSLSLPLSIASATIAGQRRMKKSKRKAIENKSLIAPAGKIKLLNQLCQRCCHWEIALKGVYLGGWERDWRRKTCGILWLSASRVPRAQLLCK